MSPAGILSAIGGAPCRCRWHRVAAALVAFAVGPAAAQPNLLVNDEFDTDLAGWTRYLDRPAEWGAQDLFDRPHSGSVLLTHDEPLASGNLSILRQCVPITAPGAYRISGWIYNLPDQEVPGNASIFVQPARNADCSGGFGTATGPAASPTANWQYREWDFTVSHETVAWQAILVSLAVSKAQAVTTPRRARFDHVALRYLDAPADTSSIFVTRSGNGLGTVGSDPAGIDCGPTCVAHFAPGTTLRLTAAPVSGFVFTRWTGGPCLDSAEAICRFIVEQPDTASAEFTTANTLSVLFDGAGSGRVTSSPGSIDCPGICSGTFLPDTVVTLVASALPGSVFDHWEGDCAGGDAECVLTMGPGDGVGDRTALAVFADAPQAQALDAAVSGEGGGHITSEPAGIDCPGACSASFAHGSEVVLFAEADAGSVFAGWEDATCAEFGSASCVVTLVAPLFVSGRFDIDDDGLFADGFDTSARSAASGRAPR